MTRIIGGTGKGRRLRTPRGDATRPTGARVRQTLFDILAPRVPGCRFLDAFAGNGGVGLEALSRGAARVVLVDQSRAAIEVIRENARPRWPPRAATCRSTTRTRASPWPPSPIPASASTSSTSTRPTRAPSTSRCSRRRRALLRAAGVVVAEHFHKRALPETIGGLVSTRSVRIGDHTLTFYEARHDSGKTMAVYPGSFDPITNGHLDIIARGLQRVRRGHHRHPAQPGEAAAVHGRGAGGDHRRGLRGGSRGSRWTRSRACSWTTRRRSGPP